MDLDGLPINTPVRITWNTPGDARAAVSLGYVVMFDRRYVILGATVDNGRPAGILCIARSQVTSWAHLVPA